GRPEVSGETWLPPFAADGHLAEPIRDWAQAFEDPGLQAEARARLREAIDSLPPDYRTAFVLHDMEGVSNPEIGELLGISLPAVKSRVHRSRLFLRQPLAAYFGRPALAAAAGPGSPAPPGPPHPGSPAPPPVPP